MQTAQTQLVAEELSVPIDRVTLIQCDTDVCPDQGTTSGSQSTPTNFNERNLGQAGATARETLLRLASKKLGVAVDQLAIAAGVVTVAADPSKRVTYGELVAGKKFNVAVDAKATRKAPGAWTVLGTSVPRLDMAAMATGQFEFVQNVRVPGMLHGAVVRPPEVGATLVNADEASVRGLPGVVAVVVKKNFVGVVAREAVAGDAGGGGPEGDLDRRFRAAAPARILRCLRTQPSRDVGRQLEGRRRRLAAADTVVKATYLHVRCTARWARRAPSPRCRGAR
jgi:CO/xanthine dehydrogenase Mo-binding subunit